MANLKIQKASLKAKAGAKGEHQSDVDTLNELLNGKTGTVLVAVVQSNRDANLLDLQYAQRGASSNDLLSDVNRGAPVRMAWVNSVDAKFIKAKFDAGEMVIGKEYETSIQITERSAKPSDMVVVRKDGNRVVPKPRLTIVEGEPMVALHNGLPIYRTVSLVSGKANDTILPINSTLEQEKYDTIVEEVLLEADDAAAREFVTPAAGPAPRVRVR